MNQRSFKRVVALLLALCMIPLTACGQSATDGDSEPTVSVVTTTVTTTAAPTTVTTTATTAATETSTVTTTTTTAATTVPATTVTQVPTDTKMASTTMTTQAPTTTTTAKPQKVWELYWSDEFDGDGLDMSKWNIESGTNGEVVKKAENVKVEDGNCVITVRRDDSTPGFDYSSAYVTTAYKFSFCFGRLEFRAKLPTGQGMWPALWTLGDNYLTIGDDAKAWPLCGEIDVMELVGSSDPQNPFDNKKILGTLHWGPDRDSHEQAHKSLLLSESPADDYHVYAVEWDEDEMVWFVDDREYMRVKLDDPDMGSAFLQKHWIIMNINLSNHDDTTPDSASMYVDYVRVYKEKK